VDVEKYEPPKYMTRRERGREKKRKIEKIVEDVKNGWAAKALEKKKKLKEMKSIKYSNNPNKLIKKEELFENDGGFNSIGELFGYSKELEQGFKEYEPQKPLFDRLVQNKNQPKENKKIECLVIWDIENVHFYDDFAIITRQVKKENQLKIVSFSQKFRKCIGDKIDFELNKLKKRGWVIEETKKIADDKLYETYTKYKENIQELIIISNDSDFKPMMDDAIAKNIHTTILHRNGRKRQKHWYSKADLVINIREI
jgi:hypothetical protein